MGFVAYARVGTGFAHHGEEGGCGGEVGGGEGLRERVDVACCGVERGVAFDAGDGVAFEVLLVEEDVYDFIWWGDS